MASKRRRTSTSTKSPLSVSRRVIVYVALGAFVLLDVLLIAWALTANKPDGTAPPPAPVPTFRATPTSAPEATPDPESPAAAVTAAPTRILAAVDATTAWRATTGPCPTTVAQPELTTDSGTTWTSTDATATAEVTAVQQLMPVSESQLSLVALDEVDCSPQLASTFVGGDDYATYPAQLGTAWFLNPTAPSTIHTPAGEQTAPCTTAVAVAPSTTAAAAVLCSDQTVFTTTDSGSTWSSPAAIAGAVGITSTSNGYLLAATAQPNCVGVQLVAVIDATASLAGCYPSDLSADQLAGTAISHADDNLWLWAGDTVARSSDSGATWS